MNPGNLYLIPTTLADLKAEASVGLVDWSLPGQVRSTAASLGCFAVENAKSARAFLKMIGIERPMQELEIVEVGHQPQDDTLKPLVGKLLGGINVGVLVEAGCPGVADPGAQLARLAHAAGIRVIPLTGPSSLMLALMASGLDGQRFAFGGYAPVKSPLREAFIKKLEARSRRESETQLLIETPYRNVALWGALLTTLQEQTRLTRAIALTLPQESVLTRTVAEWRRAPDPSAAFDKQPAVFLFLAC